MPKHMFVKVLAVALALLLWFHVVSNKNYEHVVAMPFQITDVPEDLILVSDIPDTCEMRIVGVGKQLLRFLAEVDEVAVSAKDYSTGLYVVDVTPDRIIVDHMGLTEVLEVISPQKLRLQFEELLEKTVGVEPDLVITAAPGYQVSGPLVVSPDSVVISGPKRLVRKIKKIKTQNVTISELTESLEEHIELSFPDSSYISLSDSSILAEQEVIELSERTISGIPLTIRNSASLPSFTVKPESISVTVEAIPELLDSLSVDEFKAYINLGEAVPGSTFVTPDITVPRGLQLVDTRPKEILIEVPRE